MCEEVLEMQNGDSDQKAAGSCRIAYIYLPYGLDGRNHDSYQKILVATETALYTNAELKDVTYSTGSIKVERQLSNHQAIDYQAVEKQVKIRKDLEEMDYNKIDSLKTILADLQRYHPEKIYYKNHDHLEPLPYGAAWFFCIKRKPECVEMHVILDSLNEAIGKQGVIRHKKEDEIFCSRGPIEEHYLIDGLDGNPIFSEIEIPYIVESNLYCAQKTYG